MRRPARYILDHKEEGKDPLHGVQKGNAALKFRLGRPDGSQKRPPKPKTPNQRSKTPKPRHKAQHRKPQTLNPPNLIPNQVRWRILSNVALHPFLQFSLRVGVCGAVEAPPGELLNPQSSILYTLQLTLDPRPSTWRGSGSTPRRLLNPQPSTLNPQPSTLNPKPSTLNPQPSTLNPQPETPNHEP
jgi:hypothetical protein